MSLATPPLSPPPPPGPPNRQRPFTVDEYQTMIRHGVLGEDDSVELLEGWVVFKMPRDPPHDVAVGLVADALSARVPAGWHVRDQSAITTADSEPEPDAAVARGVRRDYAGRHPGPGDLLTVVEVAESSVDRDRDKARVYARAGIPVYWIVNLLTRRVEVYSQPDASGPTPRYAARQDYGESDTVPFNAPGQAPLTVPVRELLP